MTNLQKIIKYLALGFAFLLIFSIISTIFGVVYGLANILGLRNNDKKDNSLKSIQVDQVSNYVAYLDIDVKYTDLILKEGEKLSTESSSDEIEIKQDGDKLKIEDKRKNKSLINKEAEKLVIYIPRNLKFEKVKIKTEAGKVEIENLDTEVLKLDLGAGETIIQNIKSNDTDIDTGVGKFIIENGELNNLDFDMGVGESNIKALITGKSEIDSGIGKLELELLGKKEDYKIKCTKGIGEIRIDGRVISNDNIIGDGNNIIDIDGNIGEIKVKFEDKI